MLIEEKKIGKWNALIHFDVEEKLYSIFQLDESGGAVITSENKEKAEKDFEVGMMVAKFVNKVLKNKMNKK